MCILILIFREKQSHLPFSIIYSTFVRAKETLNQPHLIRGVFVVSRVLWPNCMMIGNHAKLVT